MVIKYVLPALNKNDDTVEHSGEVKITVSFQDSDTDPIGDNNTEVHY
ncbi:hypothetical protein [Mucilaginibacter aquaedulcis]|nr:hypothetical protein [Mucilaginibacter aquaedulcis]MDN3551607.1 hypothetical protein [Mucilaginibacter aquaedulcis]